MERNVEWDVETWLLSPQRYTAPRFRRPEASRWAKWG